MPKETFYNLSEDKKDRIMKAALKELSEHHMNELSINRIIRDADISRGSFYQYFEDKYDLVSFVTESFRSQLMQYIDENIFGNENYVEKSEELFRIACDYFSHEQNRLIFQNIFTNSDENNTKLCEIHSQMRLKAGAMVQGIDKSMLRIRTDEEIIQVIELIVFTFVEALMRCMLEPESLESISSDFRIKNDIILNGVLVKHV